FLASGTRPDGMKVPLRNMQAEALLFREANLPLMSEELKLNSDYDRLIGAQTVEWNGEERTVLQLRPVYQDPRREQREQAWRLAAARQLTDRQAINDLWCKLLQIRLKLAANAGHPDYRSYRWQQTKRFDYTPQDAARFHQTIETVVVPAAERIYARRRERLGVKALRPWDLDVDPLGRPPLRPFHTIQELEDRIAAIFMRVDPELGKYFETMRSTGQLDLDNRKGKAPGGYCTQLPVIRRPFIFVNAVGIHDDVQTLLHECGHAFHVFETSGLPYYPQLEVPTEFAEVASMGMELLGSPYLASSQGGFYSEADAARARIEHLEGLILFWPYMAVVDAFQHWAYENPAAAADPANLDAKWAELWNRYMRGVDFSGLEPELATGWQRKLHILQIPFYYIEYGLAQLGAVQIWRNSLQHQAKAVADYRSALALGGTVTLPELFEAAGARFGFDEDMLGAAVELIENTIAKLEITL
ncbi:MAG TPA: M3 family oligoendopeptidase, partial [Anaerolineales bacterium]